MNFQKGRDSYVYTIKSYRQVKAHWQAGYRDMHPEVDRVVYREVDWQVYQVDQDSTEGAYCERIHEVDRMVTAAGFERRDNAEYR